MFRQQNQLGKFLVSCHSSSLLYLYSLPLSFQVFQYFSLWSWLETECLNLSTWGKKNKKQQYPTGFRVHRDHWRQGQAEAVKADRNPVSQQQKCTGNHSLRIGMSSHCSCEQPRDQLMHKWCKSKWHDRKAKYGLSSSSRLPMFFIKTRWSCSL